MSTSGKAASPPIAAAVATRENKAPAETPLSQIAMPSDNDQPATKQDLALGLDQLRAEINQHFAQVDQRFAQIDQRFAQIDGRFDQLRDDLTEKMRDMQTEVLRAFHGWAAPLEIRLRALPNIEERLGLLEERVSKIERRGQLS